MTTREQAAEAKARKIVAGCTEECKDHSVNVHVAKLTRAIADALLESPPPTGSEEKMRALEAFRKVIRAWDNLSQDICPESDFDNALEAARAIEVNGVRGDGTVRCRACSEAGGADRDIYHDPPACPHDTPTDK